MANDQVTYYCEGRVGNRLQILEVRTSEKYGMSKYMWSGKDSGGNHIKLTNPRPFCNCFDKVKRPQELIRSLSEIVWKPYGT